ncbi:MAG: prepilin peptidase [Deltaproteobacteria bacterium]|nr:prepilin peptidase [Deltaproteobacteria bacterium]
MERMLPSTLLTAYAFGVGACIGSFLNVVIARLPAGESVVRPRSRCPTCKHPIAWYDNIPLLSYALLCGRCRHCRQTIQARYFLVELAVGCLFAAFWVRFGLSFELVVWLPLAAALMAIVFLDIDHWWIPDVIVIPAMVLTFAAAWLPGRLSPVVALLGLLPALFVWGIAWIFEVVTKREGLGLGDVKLLALLGLALGPVDGLSVLLLAALQGSVIGVLVLLTGGHRTAASAEPPKNPATPEAAPPSPAPTPPATPTAAPGVAVAPPAPASADDDDWVPPPRAIPFGPFLVLAALEVVLLPEPFADLPQQIAAALLGLLS